MDDIPEVCDLPVGIGATGHRRESDSMGAVDVPAAMVGDTPGKESRNRVTPHWLRRPYRSAAVR